MKRTGQRPSGHCPVISCALFTKGMPKHIHYSFYQPYFMQKDLFTLDNEPNEDEFDKMLQEFIDEEFDSDDDDNLEDDDEELSIRVGGERNYMPFTLDAQLTATIGQPEPCQICSTDDILTSLVDTGKYEWEVMALKPGNAQLRRFVVESRQLAVYNDYRKAMSGEALPSKGHLLISTRNKDFDDQLYGLHRMVAGDFDFSRIDCSTLFDASRNNPYEQLFEEMSMTGKRIFCLTNIGALLSTGGKVIVKKVLEKIRTDEERYLLWMCGYKQDIDAVLNMYPSMNEFFPADRRLEQEPYKDFELVQAFFIELRNQFLYCSTEAMDALARALIEGWQRGVLSTWTLTDIRQFVTNQVKPRYLARCYREIESDELPAVEIDDLCFDQITSTEATTEECFADLAGSLLPLRLHR